MTLPTPPPDNAPIAWRQAYAFILQVRALRAVDEARRNPTPDTIGSARRILFYLNNFGQEAVHDIAL